MSTNGPSLETPARSGSSRRWGPLWGARPSDWALSEDQQLPTYEAALRRAPLRAGEHVLDIGCGCGAFLRLVADRGARPSGVDASEALVAVARARVPGADVRVADMEALPYPDGAFDLVTGFNSFFFADDMVAALREAARVAKAKAPVIIQVWGRHERCDLEAMKKIVRPFLPSRPSDAPPEPELGKPGVLEEVATAAGLVPESAFEVTWAYEYPDDDTLGRAMLAPAGIGAIVGPTREAQVRSAVVDGLAPYRQSDGSYRLTNEFRILIARA